MKRRTKKKKVSRWTRLLERRRALLERIGVTEQDLRTVASIEKKIQKASRGW